MRDVLGPGTTLGYCTNVHAGATLAAVQDNLERYGRAVRQRVCPDEPLGIGLWLPADAARDARPEASRLAAWLEARDLDVFTINGFPAGDFHHGSVKHRVYHPSWAEPERLAYTLDLVHLLAALRPAGGEGSISTLPIGWRPDVTDAAAQTRAARHLREAARAMAEVETRTGTLIHLDLEPEPGCLLDRGDDVVAFFGRHLLGGADEPVVRRHLRVCHDVCHAAVMFEAQADVLAAYATAGIGVGKVQISSAVRVSFDALDDADRVTAREQLAAFGEDRYLHQTAIRPGAGAAPALIDDLPEALAAAPVPSGQWRVHYHVPVFLARFGLLETTRDEIDRCLQALAGAGDVRHFEVETYAWDVLPEPLRTPDLAAGIARELDWVRARAGAEPAP